MNQRNKPVSILRGKRIRRTVIFALTFLILGFLIYAAVPKYPQPEYEVENYAEFSETLLKHSSCIVPPSTMFSNGSPSYYIYLKTRFRFFNQITGYRVGFSIEKSDAFFGVMECQQISTFSGVLLPIQPTETYSGIGIAVFQDVACFEIGDYRYTVAYGENSREIAYALIDALPADARTKSIVEPAG